MKIDVRVLNVSHGDCFTVVVQLEDGKTFSMLIDGGSSAINVADRIVNYGALPVENDKPVIDLLIATHHDHDHLGGLVEVVESDRFEIRNAWAPVVLKPDLDPLLPMEDELTFTESAIASPEEALGAALSRIDYALRRSPFAVFEGRADLPAETPRELPMFAEGIHRQQRAIQNTLGEVILERYPLLRKFVDYGAILPFAIGCGNIGLPMSPVLDGDERSFSNPYVNWASEVEHGHHYFWREGELPVQPLAMALTRACFNVALTARFIKACITRQIPVSMPLVPNNVVTRSNFQVIPAPVRLDLLSPTKGLIQKLKDKLVMPPGYALLARTTNYVSPSNKASYVFNFTVGDSVGLFTGDSGFTDFKSRTTFDIGKLHELARAQWIKVPHHGGYFEFFGKSIEHLLSQGIPLCGSVYVTSLGKEIVNPSDEFDALARKLRDSQTSPSFHFTNRPVLGRFDSVCAGCTSPMVGPDFLGYTSPGNGQWTLVNQADLKCCTNQT